jgi:glycine cleavage system regulatory protein
MRLVLFWALLLVAACGEREQAAEDAIPVYNIEAASAEPAADSPSQSPLVAPQIAYSYERRYRSPSNGIAALQAGHIAECRQLGAGACHVLEQRLTDGDSASALKLSVEATKAQTLLGTLDRQVEAKDGEVVARFTEAEDLSTQIVDVEARLRAKQALADRLLAIIRSRSGSIKDLVAAEQAFAEAQADLEAAQAELALMRGRVARSTITLMYFAPATARASFNDTLRPAFDQAGALLGESLAALLRFVILALPWALVIGLPLRWWWRRRRARKAASDKPPQGAASA